MEKAVSVCACEQPFGTIEGYGYVRYVGTGSVYNLNVYIVFMTSKLISGVNRLINKLSSFFN